MVKGSLLVVFSGAVVVVVMGDGERARGGVSFSGSVSVAMVSLLSAMLKASEVQVREKLRKTSKETRQCDGENTEQHRKMGLPVRQCQNAC